MKILMGIDDSKFSGDVLQAVITQFRPEHIEVRVLHVLQPSAPAPPQMAPATLRIGRPEETSPRVGGANCERIAWWGIQGGHRRRGW